MNWRSTVVAVAVLGMLAVAAPAEAVVSASGGLRRISTTRYELVVRNTGDESFSQFFFRPVPTVTVSDPVLVDARCTPAAEGFHCDLFTLAPGATRTVSFRTDRPYPTDGGGIIFPGQAGPVEGTGFPVEGPSGSTAPPPVIGRSELVEPVRGIVLVRRRGSRRFVRLRAAQLLPDRSEIDTRRGAAKITVATDGRGGRATATVSEGRAIIDQKRAARPTTILRLSEPLACPRRFTTASRALRKRGRRRIFVRTTGPFGTGTDKAVGTSSGTAWRTTDTCSTTTIKVVEGTVRVRDLRRRRTVGVKAPGSYTARRD
jgi:hypothetical protein